MIPIKNINIVCVIGQVWNRANEDNTRYESRRRKWKIHTVRYGKAAIESKAARDGKEVGKRKES